MRTQDWVGLAMIIRIFDMHCHAAAVLPSWLNKATGHHRHPWGVPSRNALVGGGGLLPLSKAHSTKRQYHSSAIVTSLLRGGDTSTTTETTPDDHNNNSSSVVDDDDVILKHSNDSSSLLSSASVCSIRGLRSYMEDEFFVVSDFGAVFDGHGGRAVSRYLRQNLYAHLLQAALPILDKKNAVSSCEDYEKALGKALDKIDRRVQRINHWSYQGSTVAAVWLITVDDEPVLCTANIGDSRAVLCRDGAAVDLTLDHKPNDPYEKERIESLGGRVLWCGDVCADTLEPISDSGVYRVNGNLALSRAVGDRSERPFVSAEPDITSFLVAPQDAFVILATDGLWDVMSSQEAVTFVCKYLEIKRDTGRPVVDRDNIPPLLVQEALRRGSYDNITILILWLKTHKDDENDNGSSSSSSDSE